MNLASEKFADPRMREAVLAAVDRERIVGVAYGDTVLLADGFVPDGIPGGVDEACGDRCKHDPGKARRLLGEAFPKGDVPTVRIDYDVDPVQEAVAKSIRKDLQRVDIPVELRPHGFADYGPFLVSGGPELFRLGWTADYPSADAFLYPLFHSGQNDNLTRLTVPEVDALLDQARAEPNPKRRAQLHRDAEELVLDRFPVIPIAQFTNRWVAKPGVAGFTMSALGTFDVTQVHLEGD
jgi:ABC-type transport system substrate-binding protein